MRTLLFKIPILAGLVALCIIGVQDAFSARSTDEPAERPMFYANPLVLNGKPLNYETFWIYSQGTLAVVAGNPESKEALKIPFYVYLNRDGKIIQQDAPNGGQVVYNVDVAKVLANAQPGDELIIEPARKTDWQARRRIMVKTILWPFPQNWLPRVPGC